MAIPRYNPITELDFFETIFRPMYDQSAAPSEPLSPHNLSILFTVLAIGSLVDLEAPPHSPQAMQFYQLGRASLTLESILEEQTIPGIQALVSTDCGSTVRSLILIYFFRCKASHVSLHVPFGNGRPKMGDHGNRGKDGT